MEARADRERDRLVRRLAERRVERGLTQAEVARKMGTTQPYIARLEAGRIDPRLSTLLRYAAIVAGAALIAAILAEVDKGSKQ